MTWKIIIYPINQKKNTVPRRLHFAFTDLSRTKSAHRQRLFHCLQDWTHIQFGRCMPWESIKHWTADPKLNIFVQHWENIIATGRYTSLYGQNICRPRYEDKKFFRCSEISTCSPAKKPIWDVSGETKFGNIPKMGEIFCKSMGQWIIWRENVQETIDFPMTYGLFL